MQMNPVQLVAIQSCATRAVWAGAPSCWKMEPSGRRVLQSATNFGNKVSTRSLEFTLAFLWNEVQLSFAVEADASRNHHVWRKLGSLNQKAIFIHLALLPKSPNTVVLIVYGRVTVEVLLFSEKHLLCSCLWQTSKKLSATFKFMISMVGTLFFLKM